MVGAPHSYNADHLRALAAVPPKHRLVLLVVALRQGHEFGGGRWQGRGPTPPFGRCGVCGHVGVPFLGALASGDLVSGVPVTGYPTPLGYREVAGEPARIVDSDARCRTQTVMSYARLITFAFLRID